MEWLNIHAPTLRAPEYIGSEPIARATWLNLMAYCCEQENGGRMVGAAQWKDRQWQQTCGVTKREVFNSDPLIVVDGDDIVVWRYPAEKEAEVQAKREGGARGGHRKAENRGKHVASSATSTPTSSASDIPVSASSSASTEGNGREEEGKGIPPNPQGGTGGGDSKNLPKTEEAQRLGAIFHRRSTTPWTDKEVRAFRKLCPIDSEHLAAVEAYYAGNWPPGHDKNILRHDLLTLLNNFTGEVDRAKQWLSTSLRRVGVPGTAGVPFL